VAPSGLAATQSVLATFAPAPTLMALPAVLVAIVIGVTVPSKWLAT
jgi:hypothetical protein